MTKNTYDDTDMVRRTFLMNAGGLKFATYRVRPAPGEPFGTPQHHLTHVPVHEMGFGEEKRMLISEIGATVYATLDEDTVLHLGRVLEAGTERAPGGEMGDGYSLLDAQADAKTIHWRDSYWIAVYRLPPTDKDPKGKIELQLGVAGTVLGLLTRGIAETFCTLAGQSRDGRPSWADRTPPGDHTNDEAVLGGVAQAITQPGEIIDPSELDNVD